ncbi:MAG: PQQ-dependent sugar dehydrogenase [Actinomycetota bacterium]
MSIRRVLLAGVLLIATVAVAAPTQAAPSSISVPVGFAVSPFSAVPGLATSLDFGPDTRAGAVGSRLYATSFGSGQVVVIDDLGGLGTPARTFASGFGSPLGVLVGPDGTVYVSDAEAAREGPFGRRVYGRVWRVRDVNQDGDALDATDTKEVVLKDLPNGRHNTNGLALGSDGLLYITNGNSTDDGVEGGDPEVPPWSGSVVRIDPSATNVSVSELDPATSLVATGMRNLFDVAFSPVDPTHLLIPMNGTDDARRNDEPPPDHIEDSDDLLYLTDVDNAGPDGRAVAPAESGQGNKSGFRSIADDFGFPSCLYNVARQGNLEPYDNPNPDVIEQFGSCPTESVVRPIASFGLHPSADGLAFQTTDAWGGEFTNDLFVCEFGNFFGDEVTGHQVVRVELDPAGSTVISQGTFLEGVTPLDLTFDDAGVMYVADFTGSILRVDRI